MVKGKHWKTDNKVFKRHGNNLDQWRQWWTFSTGNDVHVVDFYYNRFKN